MIRKILLPPICFLSGSLMLNAENLLVEDSMNIVSINELKFPYVDQGWVVKGPGYWLFDYDYGSLTLLDSSRSVSQVVSVSSSDEAGISALGLSFDYTVHPESVGSTAISFQLIGWVSDQGMTPSSGDFFDSINANGSLRVDTADGSLSHVDLLAGGAFYGHVEPASEAANGAFKRGLIEVVGEPGQTRSFQYLISLSSLNEAYNTLDEFSYLGVRFFATEASESNLDGNILSNVKLVKINEPKTVGLWASTSFLGMVLIVRRRRIIIP
ncbi:MAG: hypothetical protein ACPGN3_08635 [Opitutales bacterium]